MRGLTSSALAAALGLSLLACPRTEEAAADASSARPPIVFHEFTTTPGKSAPEATHAAIAEAPKSAVPTTPGVARSEMPAAAPAITNTDAGADLDAEVADLNRSLDIEIYRAPEAGIDPANFGWLTVITEPRGVPIEIADPGFAPRVIGQSPVESYRLVPGKYDISIRTKCYYPAMDRFQVGRGEKKSFTLELEPRVGQLKVRAATRRGRSVKAVVYVDGEKVGKTPGVFTVPICAEQLRVVHPRLGAKKRKIYIKESGVTSVRVKL